MIRSKTFRRTLVATVVTAAAVAPWIVVNQAAAKQQPFDVLVFTKSAGFRHPSIETGAATIVQLGAANGFNVDQTADSAAFNPTNLAKYEAVVFVSTTGNVLPTADQRSALEGYIRAGGGYLGIHAASDMGNMRTTWPWYLGLVGAAFKGHTVSRAWADQNVPGAIMMGTYAEAPDDAEVGVLAFPLKYKSWEPATMVIDDPGARAMHGFGRFEVREDEWYGFRTNPRQNVHVLASLDETTYNPNGGIMDGDHPIVWCQNYDGGRSVYTGLGHPIAAWSHDIFQRHILGAIQMAAGKVPFHCDPPPAA